MNGQSAHLQDEIANLTEEDREIDFASVSLYIPGIQAVLATVATSTVTVLVCSLSPTGTASSVRTLVCMVLVACAGVRRPVQLRTPARGMRTVFAALRPGPLLYTLCLVIEQLTHSCATNDISEGGRFYRSVLFHACAVLAAASGFYRSTRPRSESDNALRLTLLAGTAIALLPPAPTARAGPLCLPPAVFESIERVLRSFAFACLYTAMVYASAPISNTVADSTLCVLRSFAASVWTLAVHWTFLFLAPAQLLLLIWTALQPSYMQYDAVMLPSDARRSQDDDRAFALAEAGHKSTSGTDRDHSACRKDLSGPGACARPQPHLSTGMSRMFAVDAPRPSPSVPAPPSSCPPPRDYPAGRPAHERELGASTTEEYSFAFRGARPQKASLRGLCAPASPPIAHIRPEVPADDDFLIRVERAERLVSEEAAEGCVVGVYHA